MGAPEAATDGGTPAWLTPFDPNPRVFPPGFLWGSSTAAFQIERGLDNTDWAAFLPGHIAGNGNPDDGPRSRQYYKDDIKVLTGSHQNAYRFGCRRTSTTSRRTGAPRPNRRRPS